METEEKTLETLIQEQLENEIKAFKESPTPKVDKLNKFELFLFKKILFSKQDIIDLKPKKISYYSPNPFKPKPLKKIDEILNIENNNTINKFFNQYYNSTNAVSKIYNLFKITSISSRLKNRIFFSEKERMFFDILKTKLHGYFADQTKTPLTYSEKEKMANNLKNTEFFDKLNYYNKSKGIFKKISALFILNKTLIKIKSAKNIIKEQPKVEAVYKTNNLDDLFN